MEREKKAVYFTRKRLLSVGDLISGRSLYVMALFNTSISGHKCICFILIQPIPIYKHSIADGLGTKIQAWVIVRGGTMS